MCVTAAKDGVLIRRRLRIFAAAVALVLLCAVCVGGVSGATWEVPKDGELYEVVNDAGDGDTIIITENYVIKNQVVLDHENVGPWYWPIYAEKDITITNAPGVDVVISSGMGTIPDGTSWDGVDIYTPFMVKKGTLTIEGNSEGGSITFDTNKNGRAFDVKNGASLIMNSGVKITNCGYSGNTAASNNGGAVYVRSGGSFTMNGGIISDNRAGAGGGVYIDGGGEFVLNGGAITKNFALNTGDSHDHWGGGFGQMILICLNGMVETLMEILLPLLLKVI